MHEGWLKKKKKIDQENRAKASNTHHWGSQHAAAQTHTKRRTACSSVCQGICLKLPYTRVKKERSSTPQFNLSAMYLFAIFVLSCTWPPFVVFVCCCLWRGPKEGDWVQTVCVIWWISWVDKLVPKAGFISACVHVVAALIKELVNVPFSECVCVLSLFLYSRVCFHVTITCCCWCVYMHVHIPIEYRRVQCWWMMDVNKVKNVSLS